MKNLYTLIAFIAFTTLTAFGQGKVDYESRTRFYLGFNLGATYHSKTEVDVNSLYRGGAGFIFGYSFGMKPGNLLSVDLQARYLLGAYRGLSRSRYTLNTNTNDILNLNEPPLQPILDYQTDYGYYVPNFHTWVNDWSLELKLNTNRLRERTGWNFFVLGGVGLTRYTTRIDLYRGTSSDPFALIPEADLGQKGASITDYETELVRKEYDWMPSFGAGIERQITPNAAFQLMGRMTWTRNNDFDGLTNAFNGQATGTNDRYHYASAGVKVYLGRGRGRVNQNGTVTNPRPTRPTRPNTPAQGRPPTVRFTTPVNSPTNTPVQNYTVNASIQNVAGNGNITFVQNGQNIQNYSYNANSGRFSFNSVLMPGQNIFSLSAVNNFGQAQDQTIIVYNPPITVNPPVVTITNPANLNATVGSPNYNFSANVLNVNNRQNVSVVLNGANYTNFNFNPNNGRLTAALNLVPGTNTVTVSGTNVDGTANGAAQIVYRNVNTGSAPIVNITNPEANPFQTNNANESVSATVQNVVSKNNIMVSVNGNNTSNFSFSGSQVRLTTNLVIGNNTIAISASNQFGQDAASTVINYTPIQTNQPPLINLINPANGSATVNAATYNFSAQVLHVSDKQNITVFVNGFNQPNFSFNSNVLNTAVNLTPGKNVVTVTGTNNDGTDSKTAEIIYRNTTTGPPPVVNITKPASSNTVVNINNANIVASVTNVADKNNITVLVNGSSVANFNYVNGIVSFVANLNQGNNVVQIQGTNQFGRDDGSVVISFQPIQTPNPPVVTITAPINGSVSSVPSVAVRAQVTNVSLKNDISIFNNGQAVPNFNFNASSKIVSFNATLTAGTNVIEVVGRNNDGQDQASVNVEYEEIVNPTPPIVTIINPATDNTVFSSPSLTAQATVANVTNKSGITVLLNGTSISTFNFNSTNGLVTIPLTLVSGLSTLSVTATNIDGVSADSRTMRYKQAVTIKPPNVSFTNPSTSPTTVANNSFSLVANTTNVTTKNQITIKQNGSVINQNAYSFVGTVITIPANLLVGSNTFEAIVSNVAGTSNDISTIIYKEEVAPCTKPTIGYVSPVPNAVVQVARQVIEAQINNYTPNTSVSLKLNGSTVGAMTYNSATQIANKSVLLKSGKNILEVTVSNDCGTNTSAFELTYNAPAPCNPPAVAITSKGGSVLTKSYSLTALLTDVSLSSQVSVKLNGALHPFKLVNGNLVANLSLRNGNNTIEVLAKTNCGDDSKIVIVNSNPCTKPSLSQLNPSSLTVSTTGSNYNVALKALGTISQRDLLVKLNGKAIPFAFDARTGIVSISISGLVNGLNRLQISVNNNCGSASLSYKITTTLCVNPSITVLAKANSIVTKANYSFKASVSGVMSQNQVSVTLNGKAVSFRLNPANGGISASVLLKEGKNTIVSSVKNDCGADSQTSLVTLQTCTAPQISAVSPNSNSTTQSASATFIMRTVGITSNNQITAKLNGKVVSHNLLKGNVSVSVKNLNIGNNSLQVTVKNNCGSDAVTYRITREICKEPVINQQTNATSVSVLTFPYAATVTGVVSKQGISLKLNNRNVAFSFNSSTGVVTASMQLIEGTNRIQLLATNNCGNATKNHSVKAVTCKKPVVTVGYPSNTTITTTNSTFSLIATGQNLSQSDIKVTNNGRNIPFTFNASNGKITVQVANMSQGSNKILIKGTNPCGSSQVLYTINYSVPSEKSTKGTMRTTPAREGATPIKRK